MTSEQVEDAIHAHPAAARHGRVQVAPGYVLGPGNGREGRTTLVYDVDGRMGETNLMDR